MGQCFRRGTGEEAITIENLNILSSSTLHSKVERFIDLEHCMIMQHAIETPHHDMDFTHDTQSIADFPLRNMQSLPQ